ncbi:Ribonuclease E/G-like protein chloroplastic [Bienertia sinuspersici]
MVCPVNCHYNCVIRDTRWTCYDVISRVKLRFPLSNYVHDKTYGVTLGRLYTMRPKTHSQGSLIQEQHLPIHPSITALSRDQEDIMEYFESGSSQEKPFLNDLIVANGYYFRSEDTDEGTKFTERNQPVEEPWLLQPYPTSYDAEEDSSTLIDSMNQKGTLESLSNKNVDSLSSNNIRYSADSFIGDEEKSHQVVEDFNLSFSDRDQPVEDPWLLYQEFDHSETDVSLSSTAGAPPTTEPNEDVTNLPDPKEQQHQTSEKLLSATEGNLLPPAGSVSTEILINCSICTMQRIAVLEDGNLVELLLEPVKSNVQCDSVYLGVVLSLFLIWVEKDVNFIPCVTDKNLDISQLKRAFLEDDDEQSDDEEEVDFEDEDVEERVNDNDMDFEQLQTENLTSSYVRGFENQLDGNGNHLKVQTDSDLSTVQRHRSTNDIKSAEEMWACVRKGTKILVQVVKEGLGRKGPTLTAYPKLRSRFWISGVERTRLRVIAKSLQPPGFGVTIRTVATGHSVEELRKDLEGLLSTWRNILEHAKSAALAADEGVEGAVPVILHQAMGQTLSVVQDYFNEKVSCFPESTLIVVLRSNVNALVSVFFDPVQVKRMVVDSPRTYHEVIAPELCDRVELHRKKVPLFDEFNIEEEINNILNKRVALPNGGSLVIEQTEALVSIDVNGGHGMFGQGASQEKAILDVNLAAAKQIARELRLRDIGGIIVVDFIDMMDDSNKRLVYEEVKKAVERDRSVVKVSELSKHGLMEITRKRVRPSVTFMVSEPCSICHGTGRVEALETSFSKIEHEICRLLATMDQKAVPENPKSWPRLLLRVDSYMSDYLISGKKNETCNFK